MPDRWPVVITDGEGGKIVVSLNPVRAPGMVLLTTTARGVALDAAQREELAQALVAASHDADRQGAPDG